MGSINVVQIRNPIFSVSLGDREAKERSVAVTEIGPILLGSL